jgi:hypothetical protein
MTQQTAKMKWIVRADDGGVGGLDIHRCKWILQKLKVTASK